MKLSWSKPFMALAAFALLAPLLAAPALAGDAAEGAKAFKRRCVACHVIEPGARHRVGPNLAGLFSRQAGKAEGFKYSPGLAAADYKWDEPRLDAWLTNSKAVIPQTKMMFNLKDATERANIIAYLQQQGQ